MTDFEIAKRTRYGAILFRKDEDLIAAVRKRKRWLYHDTPESVRKAA